LNPNSTTLWGPGLFGGALNPGDLDPTLGCKPDCLVHPLSRDNHLGNYVNVDPNTGTIQPPPTGEPEAARYVWTIPNRLAGLLCVVRYRYNISTNDYGDHTYLPSAFDYQGANPYTNEPNQIGWGSDYNCQGQWRPTSLAGTTTISSSVPLSYYHCYTVFDPTIGPSGTKAFFDRPYVPVFSTVSAQLNGIPTAAQTLGLAINSDQLARTFQDRSYVFNVAARPSSVPASATIVNLNMRGRRGNIVQCYPAVEYDFIPNRLTLNEGDYLHVQIHGSDFNSALNANDGEGWQYSDRSNMVQIANMAENLPVFPQQMNLFPDINTAYRFALLDQPASNCQSFTNGQNNDQNNYFNCGKLNMAAERWPNDPSQGLLPPAPGTYYYMNSRNNNFSNRSQKGMVTVNPSSSSNQAAIIAGATIAGVGVVGVAAAGVLWWGKRHPNSRAGDAYKKCAGCMPKNCKTSNSAYGAGSTGYMEYVRH